MKDQDRTLAREALAAIMLESKVRTFPERPLAYRRAFEQLARDYEEVDAMIGCLLKDSDSTDERSPFDAAIGYVKLMYLRTSRQPDVNPLAPYEFRTHAPITIGLQGRNFPHQFALMLPLHGLRFSFLIKAETPKPAGSYTHAST
ncbi:hypothetical protein IT407_00870 [Candidatus Uhrbacteria bacterium]|nr:hypothetical protein [Candidatus Uhrbacteria bacterium]